MTGVEIDFVVTDSRAALALYEKIFPVERLEVTDLPIGRNEAVFTVFGTRFHMLDENPAFQLIAPRPGAAQSMWLNILVEDIADTYRRAIEAGCAEVQPVTELGDFGVSNALFSDPFGYVWMLHQLHRVVGFEDRMKLWADTQEKG
ncbi:MAG: VOC family protein [Clostridiales bacterium]|nr:VOC family protein [Clostridiales bacterium]